MERGVLCNIDSQLQGMPTLIICGGCMQEKKARWARHACCVCDASVEITVGAAHETRHGRWCWEPWLLVRQVDLDTTRHHIFTMI